MWWKWCLDEPGVAQELDEHLVDEDVLRDGLHHHHPLLTEHAQNRRDVEHLNKREQGLLTSTPPVVKHVSDNNRPIS